MDTGTCKGCGEPILWGRLKNANTGIVKAHPYDAKPILRVVIGDDGIGVVRATYASHFSTCPKAQEFRPKVEPKPDAKALAANDNTDREEPTP